MNPLILQFPVAKSIGKKILNSETAKNVGNTLLTAGTETAANVIGDLVEGKNPSESAEKSFNDARKTIADTIRQSGMNQKHESGQSKKLRKRRKKTSSVKGGKKLKYSVFNDA